MTAPAYDRVCRITVIAFDGPGQGGAVPRGLYFTPEWEKPAKAVIDHFKLDTVEWLGASCGGYLSLRAAAFEPRIKRVISFPTTYWGLDMLLNQVTPGQKNRLQSLFQAGERDQVEELVLQQYDPAVNGNSNFAWSVIQGMHITGTATAYDLMQHLAQHTLEGILSRVTQDVHLSESQNDHLFPTSRLDRVIGELTCARSITARSSPPAKAPNSTAPWAAARSPAKNSSAGSHDSTTGSKPPEPSQPRTIHHTSQEAAPA